MITMAVGNVSWNSGIFRVVLSLLLISNVSFVPWAKRLPVTHRVDGFVELVQLKMLLSKGILISLPRV